MKNTIEKENYLKVVYKMEEKSQKISVTSLSKNFNVSMSTVSNMIKKLVVMNLVDSKPYKPIILTKQGRQSALEIIAKHRLIELYLVEKMQFSLDEVHEIAEEIGARLDTHAEDEQHEAHAFGLGVHIETPHPEQDSRNQHTRRTAQLKAPDTYFADQQAQAKCREQQHHVTGIQQGENVYIHDSVPGSGALKV